MPRFNLAAALAAMLLWATVLTTEAVAEETVAIPALAARVTDLTATLSAEQKASLESRLATIDTAGGAQITVLLLPTTQPETIEQFGIRLAEAWKIGHASGKPGADNGVIVIIAKADRRARIEVGYGLEGAIPDAIAKRIIAEQMTPRFKQGDFYGGIQATVEGLEMASRGEALAQVSSERSNRGQRIDVETYGIALMVAAVMASVLKRLLGLFGSFVAAGVVGLIAVVFGASWIIAGLIALAIFVLSFFKLDSRGTRGGFSSGGFGGGGGGGFSGGGGSFGGGGASGSW